MSAGRVLHSFTNFSADKNIVEFLEKINHCTEWQIHKETYFVSWEITNYGEATMYLHNHLVLQKWSHEIHVKVGAADWSLTKTCQVQTVKAVKTSRE